MKFSETILTVIHIIVILNLAIFAFILYRPQILANYLIFKVPKYITYYDELKDDCIIQEKIDHLYTLSILKTEIAKQGKRVLFFIPGGFFIKSSVQFATLKFLSNEFDVVTCTYPVLFDHSITKTITFLEKVINYTINTYYTKDTNVALMGHSAGCYFAYQILQNKSFCQIDKFIGVTGYFGRRFTSNKLFQLLDFLYLHSARYNKINCETLIVNCSNDFLKDSNENFASFISAKKSYYEGDHDLIWRVPSNETLLMIADIIDFVNHSEQ